MRFVTGTVTVTAAGTAEAIHDDITSLNEQTSVLSITFRSHPDNTGRVYYGDSTVSSTNGDILEVGEFSPIVSPGNFNNQAIVAGQFYVDAATNSDKVIIIALVK